MCAHACVRGHVLGNMSVCSHVCMRTCVGECVRVRTHQGHGLHRVCMPHPELGTRRPRMSLGPKIKGRVQDAPEKDQAEGPGLETGVPGLGHGRPLSQAFYVSQTHGCAPSSRPSPVRLRPGRTGRRPGLLSAQGRLRRRQSGRRSPQCVAAAGGGSAA